MTNNFVFEKDSTAKKFTSYVNLMHQWKKY